MTGSPPPRNGGGTHPAAHLQASLFDEDHPVGPSTEQAGGSPTAAAVNDMDLVESVVRTAMQTGYLVVGKDRALRVLLHDATRPGWTVTVPCYEAAGVMQLLATGLLRRGGAHHVRHGDHQGLADGVLVPNATKALLRRWTALRPMPRRWTALRPMSRR